MDRKRFLYSLRVFAVLCTLVLALPLYAEGAERVHLKYLFWANTPEEIPIMMDLLKQFEREHPGITVEGFAEPGERHYEKLDTMIAGGVAPDVIDMAVEYMPIYASKGALRNLQPLVARDEDFDLAVFAPKLVEAWKYHGDLYGLPINAQPLVLYYNKTMFDSAGVQPPTDNWNWSDFLEAAQKLTKKDARGKTVQWATYLTTWDGHWSPWVYQSNGYILDETGTKCLLDQPEAVEAISFINDLINKYKVAPQPGGMAISDYDAFLTGAIAMHITGRWGVATYRTIKAFDWDVARLPKYRRRGIPLYALGSTVSSQTRHPQEAYELAKFVTSKKAQLYFVGAGNMVPARVELAMSNEFLKGIPPTNNRAFVDSLDDVIVQPGANWNQIFSTAIKPELDLLYRGRQSLKDTIKNIVTKTNRILKESPVS